MAIEAIFRISGKVGTKFCFKENLEKTYYFKFGAS
jgi:hypothetical protein